MISKNDILNYYFGDTMRNLIRTNRLYLIIIPSIVILWLGTYVLVRRHANAYEHNIADKIYVWVYLSIGIVMTLGGIFMLIFFPMAHWK